jgi:putative transposase
MIGNVGAPAMHVDDCSHSVEVKRLFVAEPPPEEILRKREKIYRSVARSVKRVEGMKKRRFSEEQIMVILKQREAGLKLADICREHGISAATFYGWRAKFGGLDAGEAQRMRQVQDENRRLKQLVADLSLDREALKAVIRKSGLNRQDES